MLEFTAIIHRYANNGEKSGWRYINITAQQAHELKPDTRTSFRVKGTLDAMPIEQVALIPVGDGSFIMSINARMRKILGKENGALLHVSIELDNSLKKLDDAFMLCLKDEPEALKFFNTLSDGHKRYFSNWIQDAQTDSTRTKRIARSVEGLAMGMDFGQMIRYFKSKK